MAVLLAAVGAAAACAGSSSAAVGPGATAVSAAQLALMPLPLAQLAGRDGLTLSVDPHSGVRSNATAAADSIDPADSAATLAAAGRITGYELQYASTRDDQLSTAVELFSSEEAAANGLAKHVRDFTSREGQTVGPGAKLVSVTTWTPASLGDEGSGLDALLDVGGTKVRGTVVAFRLGRLVGSASFVRTDGRPMHAATEQSARALLARVRGVLDGSVTGAPVPVPKAPATTTSPGSSSARPAGAPDITPAALALADLPAGATVEKSTWTGPGSDSLVELERDYAVAATRIGSSRLISLQNDVTLYRTAAGAAAFVGAVTGVYRSPSAASVLSSSMGKGDPALANAKFTVDSVRAVKIGDGGTLVRSSIKASIGSFRAYFAFVRVGRVVTALIATGLATTTHEADVATLLARAAKRAAAVR